MQETDLTLDDLLADPLVRLVMHRDDVEEAHVRALMRRVRDRLRAPDRRNLSVRPHSPPERLSTGVWDCCLV
jgi:hypothetical protein